MELCYDSQLCAFYGSKIDNGAGENQKYTGVLITGCGRNA